MKAPSLTIGIEEEYQIIDPQTRELRSYITQILEEGRLILKEQVKPELHQSIVEVGSSVCQTPAELRTGTESPAPRHHGTGGQEWIKDRRRWHPPFFFVEGAGYYTYGPLCRGEK